MTWLPFEQRQSIRELADVSENPFYWREMRRDARRSEPWRSLLIVGAWIVLLFPVAGAGIWWILTVATPIVTYIGGGIGATILFSVVAGVHALLVAHAARNRTGGLLLREARGGTFYQLFMTRLSAFEIVAELSVYPFLFALLLALAGLPVYCLMAAMGLLPFQAVIALYLVFACLALAIPRWRLAAFQEQSPEELVTALERQGRSEGCSTWVLSIFSVPFAVSAGVAALGYHTYNPHWLPRVPSDVWSAIPLLPLTTMWVAVRVLSTPFTWFGILLPPWIWAIPLFVVGRISALWISSMYLRVAHTAHIPYLPDSQALAAWLRRVGRVRWLALLGYLWEPFLDSDTVPGLLWMRTAYTPGQRLAGMFFLVGSACMLAWILTVRRTMRTNEAGGTGRQGLSSARVWIPIPVVLAASAISSPGAFASVEPWHILGLLALASVSSALFAAATSRFSTTVWLLLLLAPLPLLLIPFGHVYWLAALNPAVVLISMSDSLPKMLPSWPLACHVPPVPVSMVVPVVGALFTWVVSRIMLLKLSRSVQCPPVALNPVPAPTSPGSAIPAPAFHSMPVPGPAAPAGASAAVPSLSTPVAPAPVPPSPTTQAATIWVPPPPDLEWRTRRLSALGSRVLHWITDRTDNPIAILGARRALPGSMGLDWAILGCIGFFMGMLIAITVPELFALFPVNTAVAGLLFPYALDRLPWGMSMFIGALVTLSALGSVRLCGLVGAAYLRERERAALGFLLVTPLPSRSIAAGYLTGPLAPALALWTGCALAGIVPAAILGSLTGAGIALRGWATGMLSALLFIALCAACGTRFGIGMERARDMSLACLVPVVFSSIVAIICAALGYGGSVSASAATGLFLLIEAGAAAWVWNAAVSSLEMMRRGDIPFEGRPEHAA